MSEYVNDIFLEALKLHVQILSDCEQTCIDKHFKKMQCFSITNRREIINNPKQITEIAIL